jgi:hypothetical protein
MSEEGMGKVLEDAMRDARNDALDSAAEICAQAAVRLISNGRARVNQVDRHTAEVLRGMEVKILALKSVE